MLQFEKITALQSFLAELKKKSLSIGFVPTMGALHDGHASLIKLAKNENDLCICSIFVNPTQFDQKEDLEKYPRTLKEDSLLLQKSGCDVLFAPSVKEMYPEARETNTNGFENQGYLKVNLGKLAEVMEGEKRPGHFTGVIQVVSKLFDIVNPDKAYFGQKDFQQQAVIREMCRQMKYGVKIITCPIVRESDGLAMSSRNRRLSNDQRKAAGIIPEVLFRVKKLSTKKTLQELNSMVETEIGKNELLALDYFHVVDADTLQPIPDLKSADHMVACIAVKAGQVRLIDNVIIN